jgi:hypothetical protein
MMKSKTQSAGTFLIIVTSSEMEGGVMTSAEKNCFSKETELPRDSNYFYSATGKMVSTYPMSVRRESFGLEAVG